MAGLSGIERNPAPRTVPPGFKPDEHDSGEFRMKGKDEPLRPDDPDGEPVSFEYRKVAAVYDMIFGPTLLFELPDGRTLRLKRARILGGDQQARIAQVPRWAARLLRLGKYARGR